MIHKNVAITIVVTPLYKMNLKKSVNNLFTD